MGKIAFVFPGQGAQYVGMGESLYKGSKAAKSLYDIAEGMRPGTMEQSFNSDIETLKITKNTQPCLYLADLAVALAFNEQGIFADGVAGFSLGEIAALSYSGAYSYEDGFKIVTKRGEYMQKCAEKFDTAMIAVLKSDAKTVEDVCAEIPDVYPVNYNSSGQTVVAGLKTNLSEFREKMTKFPCKCIDLPVGGGFHCPFMNEASENLSQFINDINVVAPQIPTYANKTALPYGNNGKEMLCQQIISPVLWQKTIENMVADGFSTFIEVGPGKTLTGFIKRISKDAMVYNAQTLEDVLKISEEVKNNG